MHESAQITCTISSSDYNTPLGIEIWLDDSLILNHDHVTAPIEFCHDLSDDSADHELRFVMKNKTVDHTTVDASGHIVKDSCLLISDLEFEKIQLGHALTELATYTHNFNGTADPVQEKFYGTMGCNGVVTVKFFTPMYLWLLENM